jgi:hypothetical protein
MMLGVVLEAGTLYDPVRQLWNLDDARLAVLIGSCKRRRFCISIPWSALEAT